MTEDVFLVVLRVHIAFAVVAALAVWPPLLARKGGRLHLRTGGVYLFVVTVATLTGLLLTLMPLLGPAGVRPSGTGMPLDTVSGRPDVYRTFLWLLAYLALVTLAAARIGHRLLRTGRRGRRLERGAAVALVLIGLLLAGVGIGQAQLPVVAVGTAGAAFGAFLFRVSGAGPRDGVTVRLDHGMCMIASGVGLWSTVAVVMANRLATEFLAGPFGVLAWAGPTVVALPLALAGRRHWRRHHDDWTNRHPM